VSSQRGIRAAAAAAAVLAAPALGAQQGDSAARLPAVEVTVSRERGRSALELPFAVTTLRPDSARPGQRLVSLDEALFLVPGVLAASRNNPAQDPRVSIRGFGARSAFGVRGIHVVRDGIPVTLPDGQTPVDFLDLESVGRVEVLRGSAASLYGNAAGGVIELRTAEPPPVPFAGALRASAGSDEMRRVVAQAAGSVGTRGWLASATHWRTDGVRDHARQRATTLLGRGTARAGATRLAVTATHYEMPLGENPGALTLAQMRDDPTQAEAQSVNRDARKTVRHSLVGIVAERGGGGRELTAVLFGGRRALDNPLPFAVIDVDRASGGAGLRGALPFVAGGLAQRVRLGVDVHHQDDDRRNFENCVNRAAPITVPTPECPIVGRERGVVTVEQRERVTGIGAFLHDELMLGARTRLTLGARYDRVAFSVRDALTEDGDQSGDRTLHAVSPSAGIVVRLTPLAAAYASISSAFETPTVTELANRPDGSAGINPDLEPQRSVTYEVGVRGVAASVLRWDVALFATRVRDELVPYEAPGGGGRRFFRNAGRTRRGAEVALEGTLGPIEVGAAYAYSRFVFDEYLVTSGGTTSDYSGNRIPGIPAHAAQASATWRRAAFFATVEALAAGAVHPDDANSARVNRQEVVHVRLGATELFGSPLLAPTVGVQNVFDRRYASSVVVNAQGGRYFEPAPGRTLFVGLALRAGH
jgi:iron complex outermembrane receptor protein